MFDSVLDRGVIPRRRLGTGAVVSVLVHAAVLALALTVRPPSPEPEVTKVIAWPVVPPMFTPAPTPPGGGGPAPRHPPRGPKRSALVAPSTIPPKPVETEPPPDLGPDPQKPITGGQIGDPTSGLEPGTGPIGPCDGVCGPGGGGGRVSTFDARGMTAPILLETGRAPAYTREALEAHVQGLMLVECVVTLEGRLQQCKVTRPVPLMERAVVEALMTRRYSPATQNGKPLAVRYTFKVKLELPH